MYPIKVYKTRELCVFIAYTSQRTYEWPWQVWYKGHPYRVRILERYFKAYDVVVHHDKALVLDVEKGLRKIFEPDLRLRAIQMSG